MKQIDEEIAQHFGEPGQSLTQCITPLELQFTLLPPKAAADQSSSSFFPRRTPAPKADLQSTGLAS
jgi:hypothetical protein